MEPRPWRPEPLSIGGRVFDFSRAYIVGVLNVTPDSFSDGGQFADPGAAVRRARELIAEGADILDIGGESTRPGAAAVTSDDEIARVVPVIAALAGDSLAVPISVDTVKASVARAAVGAGATIVNDISGGLFDGDMLATLERGGAAYVLGHVRGTTLAEVHRGEAEAATARDIEAELAARLAALSPTLRRRTIIDPGLGFGKGPALNLALTRNSGALAAALQCPVMIGPSRKRYLGALTGAAAGDRDVATIGAALAAVSCGAHFVRVHAVGPLRSALTMFEATLAAPSRETPGA